jgi:integral membrane protein (TIGR01906 family)
MARASLAAGPEPGARGDRHEAASGSPDYHARVTRTFPEHLAAFTTAVTAAVLIIAIAILPFLTPAWVSFEQGRTRAADLTGYTPTELAAATNAILHDLVVGPPAFDVAVAGRPVLDERERSHMRDVRGVFTGFALIALVSALGLAVLSAGARRMGHPERAWAAIAAGMRGLIVMVVVAGIVASVAFDAAFELFHRLFFPGGTYTFDPQTDRLVQLFPFGFWSETTIVLGVGIVIAAAAVAIVAGRRARMAEGVRVAAVATTRPEPAE